MFIKYSDIKIDKIFEKTDKNLKEIKEEKCEDSSVEESGEDSSVEEKGEEQSAEGSDD